MCSPCGPMVCYKYEDSGPPRGSKPSEGASRAEESGGQKKAKESELKRTKSRELRGGIMYYSCHCIKRNGLQHDCRRTGCGGEPACLHMPDPLCAPSQLARARGLADPGPLAAHIRAQGGGSGAGGSGKSDGGSCKKFIVCELKGITPDISADKSGNCCKSRAPMSVPTQGSSVGNVGVCIMSGFPTVKTTAASGTDKKCPCQCKPTSSGTKAGIFDLDEKMVNKILSQFDKKDVANDDDDVVIGPGGRPRKLVKPVIKEPCTKPGCIHWQPPPPCCWDAPCKADCFEAPPGIQPGRNPLTRGSGGGIAGPGGSKQGASQGRQQPQERFKFLTPNCCSGCSARSDGAATAAGGGSGPAPGMPVLVMKLC